MESVVVKMIEDIEDRHPSVQHVAQFFEYGHLQNAHARSISAEVADLAEFMVSELEDSPELAAGLRKLLEAKDCFVRAALIE